jgi:hypothetical protein
MEYLWAACIGCFSGFTAFLRHYRAHRAEYIQTDKIIDLIAFVSTGILAAYVVFELSIDFTDSIPRRRAFSAIAGFAGDEILIALSKIIKNKLEGN